MLSEDGGHGAVTKTFAVHKFLATHQVDAPEAAMSSHAKIDQQNLEILLLVPPRLIPLPRLCAFLAPDRGYQKCGPSAQT